MFVQDDETQDTSSGISFSPSSACISKHFESTSLAAVTSSSIFCPGLLCSEPAGVRRISKTGLQQPSKPVISPSVRKHMFKFPSQKCQQKSVAASVITKQSRPHDCAGLRSLQWLFSSLNEAATSKFTITLLDTSPSDFPLKCL